MPATARVPSATATRAAPRQQGRSRPAQVRQPSQQRQAECRGDAVERGQHTRARQGVTVRLCRQDQRDGHHAQRQASGDRADQRTAAVPMTQRGTEGRRGAQVMLRVCRRSGQW
ncbi:hypothetical protein ADL34_32415 [Streptomyces sp. NRRL WC-3605]|nr:hypothetical protein ADL33_32835 [Streptomyces sp. NRRL WC-3604]KUL68746.1 hypothetical protein ADL34_32415 [Streptomyces sp. NRRL WC-3605]